MKNVPRRKNKSRAATLVRAVAKHKGIESSRVRLVPVIEYPSSDDYYALFGANPEIWLSQRRQLDEELKSILAEHLIKVLPVQLKQAEYRKWLDGKRDSPANRLKYALHCLDEHEHEHRFTRQEEKGSPMSLD